MKQNDKLETRAEILLRRAGLLAKGVKLLPNRLQHKKTETLSEPPWTEAGLEQLRNGGISGNESLETEGGFMADQNNNLLSNVKEREPRYFTAQSTLLLGGVFFFGICKVILSTGAVSASISEDTNINGITDIEVVSAKPLKPNVNNNSAGSNISNSGGASWSNAEKVVLLQLDARRVELEKRKEILDKRESEISLQNQELAEKLAELQSVTKQLQEVRKSQDQRYESRLEQLAQVYGSMAPQEAAPLIGKLDDDTALALLARMPGKRMGQVLSAMDKDRAVDLTKILMNKSAL